VIERIQRLGAGRDAQAEDRRKAMALTRAQIDEGLAGLTDSYVDGVAGKDLFTERRTALPLRSGA
jgi:hypothetical protein